MAKLLIIGGTMKGRAFDLNGDPVFIGTGEDSHIQIQDGTVSRNHLKLFRIGGMFFVQDLNSATGTLINGEFIRPGEGYEVDPEDAISIGNTVIRLGDIPPHRGSGMEGLKPISPEEEKEAAYAFPKKRRTSSQNLEIINEVSEILRGSSDIEWFFEKLLVRLIAAFPAIDLAAILQFDDRKGQVVEMIATSRQDTGESGPQDIKPSVKRVLRDGRTVTITRATRGVPPDFRGDTEALNIPSVICVPAVSNARVRGVIYLDSLKRPFPFPERDQLLIEALSGPVAVAIENAQMALLLKQTEPSPAPLPAENSPTFFSKLASVKDVYPTRLGVYY
jgi:hypothetical protein